MARNQRAIEAGEAFAKGVSQLIEEDPVAKERFTAFQRRLLYTGIFLQTVRKQFDHSKPLKAGRAKLAKLKAELAKLQSESEAEWEREFGEKMPVSVEDWKEWAVRIGLDANFVLRGEFTPNDIEPLIRGHLKGLTDREFREVKGIPPERRTKPVPLKKAAKALGKTADKVGAEWVKKCIVDGTLRAEEITRQSYVFDLDQIPKENHYLVK